jgi:HD-GYP domain-containing protein (c-di-GMP phosphodiesterase class II)
MNSFKVSDLKPNIFFTSDVILDKTFVLLSNSTPVTETLLKALNDWEFSTIWSNGTIGTGAAKPEFTAVDLPQEDEETSSVIGDKVKKAMESVSVEETDTPDAETNRLNVVQSVYNEYLNYISNIYTRYATHKELNLDEISSTVKDLCIFVKENRRFVLRVQPSMEARNRNFLVSHSMRSTIYALTIGLQLRLPLSKLVELGVSCILHEIGMIRLPPQLYMNDRPLTTTEKKAMLTHPLLSYNILKSYEFPLAITLGVLEHHEKENGLGYPRKLSGDKISMYAKIISVACSFEAITAPRHYKQAQSSYAAMIELLKNEGNQYDGNVIKALLYSLSLFPIGSYVYLSDGKIGQIIDANPEDPKNPIVQLLALNSTESKTIVTGEKSGVKISRVMTKEEIQDVLVHIKH